MANLFETFMICAFGCSWPISAYNSWKSGSAEGKSLLFSVIILLGYFFGMAGKIIVGNINYVFIFYILNVVFVLLDLAFTIRNKAKDKARRNVTIVSREEELIFAGAHND
ncbi:MAG: hypothetical protein BKP49_11345 [Treponema sp. CETP13]|nr:MAG: hypothetical protein BKP49_11345 [Treponema sp. CETP13]